MIVKLLTEHLLKCQSLKGSAMAHRSLHISKCHIVRNLMHWLSYLLVHTGVDPVNEPSALQLLVRSPVV